MTLPNRAGVIGVDEVGTGSLCGPLLVCGVLVPIGYGNPRVRDSKKVGREEMARLAIELMRETQWCCVQASAKTINTYGPKEAWTMAVREVVFRMRIKHGLMRRVYMDGNVLPEGLYHAETIIKGDNRYMQIASAAIIAKYNRLRIMSRLAKEYPKYGLETNDGYGVTRHIAAILEHGLTPQHRIKACNTVITNHGRKLLRTSI